MTATRRRSGSARTARPTVESFVRLTASSYIHCCTYDDAGADPVHPGRRTRTSRSPAPAGAR